MGGRAMESLKIHGGGKAVISRREPRLWSGGRWHCKYHELKGNSTTSYNRTSFIFRMTKHAQFGRCLTTTERLIQTPLES